MILLNFIKNITPYAGVWIKITLIALLISASLDALAIISIVPILFELTSSEGNVSSPMVSAILLFISNLAVFISGDDSLESFLFVILLLLTAKGICIFAIQYVISVMRSEIQEKLRIELLKSLGNVSLSRNLEIQSGKFTNILTDQVNRVLSSFYASIQVITYSVHAIVLVSFVYFLDYGFFFYCVAITPILILIFYKINKSIRDASIEIVNKSGDISDISVFLVRNHVYLQVTGLIKSQIDKAGRACAKLSRSIRLQGIFSGYAISGKEPLGFLSLYIYIILSSIYGDIQIEILLASSLFLHRSVSAIINIQGHYQKFLENSASFEKFESFRRQLDVKKITRREKFANDFTTYDIQIKDLTMNLGSVRNPIVKFFPDVTIPVNSLVCVKGASGSGKTTLGLIISGVLTPRTGRLSIGKNCLQDIGIEDLNKIVGYVSQQPVIFTGTVDQNIGLRTQGYSSIDLGSKLAKLEQFSLIEDQGILEEFLKKYLNADNGGLSGGQMQRVHIAREILSGPKILILDEPTSALDAKNSEKILALLQKLRNDMTIILITHEPLSHISHDILIDLDDNIVKYV